MKTIFLLSFFAIIIAFSSCKKNPPGAIIKVTNENGVAVAGAEIRITADEGLGLIRPDNVNELILTTNSSGIVSRTFLDDAIYDVLAQEYDQDQIVVRSGTGVLILKVGETYTENIVIRP